MRCQTITQKRKKNSHFHLGIHEDLELLLGYCEEVPADDQRRLDEAPEREVALLLH